MGAEKPQGVDVAVYRRADSDVMVLTTLSPPAGSQAAVESATRPDDALRDELAGAGVTDYESEDPGVLNGSLACGPSSTTQLLVCAWVGGKTGGVLTFRASQFSDLGVAAAQTRSIRESITTVE